MANTFYLAPLANFTQTTLNGAITNSQTTITLNSTTNVTAPGYAIIDRQNSAGTNTPNAREVITYTGVSGNNLTGVTRGADNSTALAHADTAIVEFSPTVGMWNNLATIVATGFTSDGYLKAIASPVTIAQLHTTRGLFSTITVTTLINASGASIVGSFGSSGTGGFNALFQVPGGLASIANVGGLIPVPTTFTAGFLNAFVQTPASVASIGVTLLKNFAVMGVCEIPGGATFASTASLSSTSLVAGDVLTLDIRSTASLAADLSVMLRAT